MEIEKEAKEIKKIEGEGNEETKGKKEACSKN